MLKRTLSEKCKMCEKKNIFLKNTKTVIKIVKIEESGRFRDLIKKTNHKVLSVQA